MTPPTLDHPPTPVTDPLSPAHAARVDAILERAGAAFPFRPRFQNFRGALGAYIDEGPKDAPVLLCVHGNPTWAFFYRALIHAYAGSMRVVVPDHVGMGLSEKPKGFEYTLESRIQALQEQIEALDLRRITLVAHDWGGAIGLGAAGRLPERFERLVLSNTAAFPGLPAHALIRIARLPLLHGLLMGRLGLFEHITVHHAAQTKLPKAVRDAYLAPFANPSERVAVQAFVRDIPLNPLHPSFATLVEVENRLQSLQALPALLLWGEKDWVFTPAFRAELEKRLPNARSVPLPEAGHLLWEDDPKTCLQAVADFFHDFPSSPPPRP